MNAFTNPSHLLTTDSARTLFHAHAARAPIYDFHCHLSAPDLASDRRFENITQLWLNTDPYKHRAMRMAGVTEHFITGDASDESKFKYWAMTVPLTLGNPLYDWTSLELHRFFGIEQALNETTVGQIWSLCNSRLRDADFSARALLGGQHVAAIGTSDSLLDHLADHATLRASAFKTIVAPTARFDEATAVEGPGYLNWILRLASTANCQITCYEDFQAAISARLDVFGRLGCTLADHGLDDFTYITSGEATVAGLFARRLHETPLSAGESCTLKSGLVRFLAAECARRNWTEQFHLGAHRRTSSRLKQLPKTTGGYAAAGGPTDIDSLCGLLDDLEKSGTLPRLILYPLNPADLIPFAILSGSFCEAQSPGKVRLGAAWWYNDHSDGIRAQLSAVANHALLMQMPGMVADSRSFLSVSRHEYFRRILCDWLGQQMEAGALPDDMEIIGQLVRAIVETNPRRLFGL